MTGFKNDIGIHRYQRPYSSECTTYLNWGHMFQNNKRKTSFIFEIYLWLNTRVTDNVPYRCIWTGIYDYVITEIGGCVGDIESLPFFEAVRQARFELGSNHFVSIHLTLVPYLQAAGELKTKPTQHSVKQLLEAGIQPDILVCRAEKELPNDIRKKLALFCNVPMNSVIEARDASTIYDVPILMRKEKLDERVLSKMKIPHKKDPIIDQWKDFLGKLKNPTDEVKIGLIGKYVELKDAYKSIAESFIHAGA